MGRTMEWSPPRERMRGWVQLFSELGVVFDVLWYRIWR